MATTNPCDTGAERTFQFHLNSPDDQLGRLQVILNVSRHQRRST